MDLLRSEDGVSLEFNTFKIYLQVFLTIAVGKDLCLFNSFNFFILPMSFT